MTSAIKKDFALNPTYKGPAVIEHYCRKFKSSGSFGRAISSYNKRFLVLDLFRMVFYYLPDKNSKMGDATEISFLDIAAIYVDQDNPNFFHTDVESSHETTAIMKKKTFRFGFSTKQAFEQEVEGSNFSHIEVAWSYGITVVTKKKPFRFRFETKQVFQQYLEGFRNIVNLNTKQVLYFVGQLDEKGQQPIFQMPESRMQNNELQDKHAFIKEPVKSALDNKEVPQRTVENVQKMNKDPQEESIQANEQLKTKNLTPEERRVEKVEKIRKKKATDENETDIKSSKDNFDNNERASLAENKDQPDQTGASQESIDIINNHTKEEKVNNVKINSDVVVLESENQKLDKKKNENNSLENTKPGRSGNIGRKVNRNSGIGLNTDEVASSAGVSRNNKNELDLGYGDKKNKTEENKTKKADDGCWDDDNDGLRNNNVSDTSNINFGNNSNTWRDELASNKKKETVSNKKAKNDDDDWDKDMFSDEEYGKPSNTQPKQASSEFQSQVETKKKPSLKEVDDTLSRRKNESQEVKFETKKPVHNDWDDEF